METEMLGRNKVLMINCQFGSNTYSRYFFLFVGNSSGRVQFTNCQFFNNTISLQELNIQLMLVKLHGTAYVKFNKCSFHGNLESIL